MDKPPIELSLPGDEPDDRPRRKPEKPIPKVRSQAFMEAQQDPKVKQALREAKEEGELLEQEGKIHS